MDAVKRRSYHAPVRAEQAERTRQRILAAAAELFARDGWAGTTLQAVASAAQVSSQTVHQSVGTKPALLIGAVALTIAGEEPGVPLVDREPFRRAFLPAATPEERASAFAAGTTEVYGRGGGLFGVLVRAAADEPELAALWARAKADRLADCTRLVQAAHPRRTRGIADVADLVFVQSGPGVYLDLVVDRGWPAARYQQWLTAELTRLLAA